MEFIDVPIMINGVENVSRETVYAWDELPWNELLFSGVVRKRKISYLNVPIAFDIETTNIPDGYLSENSRPFAFMYQWQICIDRYVVFGRTVEECIQFFDYMAERMQLSYGRRAVVYVHNLSFEFQFIRRFGEVEEVFALDERKVAKFLFKNCFEFRCSYLLSNMNLSKFCENTAGVTHYKLSDTYDYRKIRTPETPLTDMELAYCYNDVYGLCECIRERMRDDDLAHIPLTSTGYLRRECRNAMEKNPKNRKLLLDSALNPETYQMMREAFRGGDVHANMRWSNQTLHDVGSFDLQSSYPAVMMLCTYPVGKFTKVSRETFLKRDWNGYHYILRLRASNVRYIGKCGNPYIPLAKCTKISKNTRDRRGYVNDNGRIQWAEMLEITFTDIDFEIFKSEYTYDELWVKDIYVAKSGRLPDELLQTMMNYYRDKTRLKNARGMEYEYAKSKNKVNAFYGMLVTDIARAEHPYENGEWSGQVSVDIADALQKYYNSRNSFLAYQWGVWVTAHARKRLRDMLNVVGGDVVYCDTDSIKFKYAHASKFDGANQEIIKQCEKYGAYAFDKDGKKQYMGIWDDEGTYDEFKTLGSKKYIVRKDGEYKTTIAGVSKKRGVAFFEREGIDAFAVGTVIPDSGHLVAYYNDDELHKITIDGHTFTIGSNVALLDGEYTLGVTNEYLDLLEKTLAGIRDMC